MQLMDFGSSAGDSALNQFPTGGSSVELLSQRPFLFHGIRLTSVHVSSYYY